MRFSKKLLEVPKEGSRRNIRRTKLKLNKPETTFVEQALGPDQNIEVRSLSVNLQ
jgi:hypothetical protein